MVLWTHVVTKKQNNVCWKSSLPHLTQEETQENRVVWCTWQEGGSRTKGMPPLRVSYYHVSPDLMGLTAISGITAQLPVRERPAQAQQSFGRIQVTQGSERETANRGHFCCRVRLALLLNESVPFGWSLFNILASTSLKTPRGSHDGLTDVIN